jgi:hypothetical protein
MNQQLMETRAISTQPLNEFALVQPIRTERTDFAFCSLSSPARIRGNNTINVVAGLELDFGIHPQRARTEPTNTNKAPCSANAPLLEWPYAAATFQKVAVGYALSPSSVPKYGKLLTSLIDVHLPGSETHAARRVSRFCRRSGAHFGAKEAHSP